MASRRCISRQGNCWYNAYVESFFETLKRELVDHRLYASRDEAKRDIFEYIKAFYTRQRRHSTSAITPQPSTKRGQ
ncbi:MAG: transposase [Nitrospira sp.]|nr:transposase [Nitrospira sp.]